jgi:hypothetical protein
MVTATFVILAGVALALLGSWAYFGRWAMTRPPIGVFNGVDVTVMIGGILLVPYLYLLLPVPVVLILLVLGMASILYALVEPLVRAGWGRWGLVVGLLAADGIAYAVGGSASPGYLAVNDGVILLVVIATANLWAGSGMSARAAAILGGVLLVYDVTATSVLPLMGEVIRHLAGLPFSPALGWVNGDGVMLIGLGDLLLAAVFPLILRRCYGETAGRVALAVNFLALLGLLTVPLGTLVPGLVGQGFFPVMAILGPLMIAQYLYWVRGHGAGRPTWQYWQAIHAARTGRSS